MAASAVQATLAGTERKAVMLADCFVLILQPPGVHMFHPRETYVDSEGYFNSSAVAHVADLLHCELDEQENAHPGDTAISHAVKQGRAMFRHSSYTGSAATEPAQHAHAV